MRQHKANHALASIKSALHFRFSMSVFFVSRKIFAWLFLLCWFVFFFVFLRFDFFEEIFRSWFTRLDLNKATILLLESRFLSLAVTPWKNYWYWSKNHAVISFTGKVIRTTNLKTIQSLNHIKFEKNWRMTSEKYDTILHYLRWHTLTKLRPNFNCR